MARNQGASDDTRTIVTVLLLIFAFPVGIIVMLAWTRWPDWLKLLITIPVVIGVIAVIIALFNNSVQSTEKDFDIQQVLLKACGDCLDSANGDINNCTTQCRSFISPTGMQAF